MKKVCTLIMIAYLITCTLSAFGQNVIAQTPEPYVVEYYYKTKWGFTDEFLTLFKKNHLPVMKKQIESGRILNVKIEKPRYHATEDGRWDFRVTIAFKNAAAFHDPSAAATEASLIKQLYPDQFVFKREEQRRFEILIAHWDVPLVTIE
ncbi:MAG: hypothetical protein M3X11_00470 [Acidobacteriota bacterium]|nr:hypothetical protein [Acidobacteriota bacterium]